MKLSKPVQPNKSEPFGLPAASTLADTDQPIGTDPFPDTSTPPRTFDDPLDPNRHSTFSPPSKFKKPIVGSEHDTDFRVKDNPPGYPKYAVMFNTRVRRVSHEYPTALNDRESVLEIPNVEYDWVGASADDIKHLKGVRLARTRNLAVPPIEDAPMTLTDAEMPRPAPPAPGDGTVDLEQAENVMTDIMGGGGDARFRVKRILERFGAEGWRIVKAPAITPETNEHDDDWSPSEGTVRREV